MLDFSNSEVLHSQHVFRGGESNDCLPSFMAKRVDWAGGNPFHQTSLWFKGKNDLVGFLEEELEER